MATKKAGGSTKNGRSTIGKRRSIKRNHGQGVVPGNILVTQLGKKYRAGPGVGTGRNGTLFAMVEGVVKFTKRKYQDPRLKNKRVVHRFIEVVQSSDVC